MTFSSISLRSLTYEHKRYTLLFLAATIGITLALSVIGLLSGMMNSLHNKARIYYGGDLMLLNNLNGDFGWNKTEENLNLLTPICKDFNFICSARIDYETNDTYFVYEGTSVLQRKIKGVNFDKEKALFSTLTFIQGNSVNIANSNGVLISEPSAKQLNVNVGDSITVLLKTTQNYTNTATLIVKGIFQDSSLFGSNISYVDIDFLRKIKGFKKNFSNTIGFYDIDNNYKNYKTLLIQKELEKIYSMTPIYTDKSDYMNKIFGSNKNKVSLITLDANLQDVRYLISAMYKIIYMIITVLILIIAIGIGSTYKVITVKRTNEIGMYMALGLKPIGIICLFLIEVFYLILGAFACSIVLSFILSKVVKLFDLSIIPSFDIFLTSGQLVIQQSFFQVISIFLIVLVTSSVLVYFTIRKSVNVEPVEALSTLE